MPGFRKLNGPLDSKGHAIPYVQPPNLSISETVDEVIVYPLVNDAEPRMEQGAEKDSGPEIRFGEYPRDLPVREGKSGNGSHLRGFDAFRRVFRNPVVFDAEVEEGAEPFQPFRKRARRTRPGVPEIERVFAAEVADVRNVPAVRVAQEQGTQETVFRDGALVQVFAIRNRRRTLRACV
jgi:hypothetical protein